MNRICLTLCKELHQELQASYCKGIALLGCIKYAIAPLLHWPLQHLKLLSATVVVAGRPPDDALEDEPPTSTPAALNTTSR